jgi:hypothetical protein
MDHKTQAEQNSVPVSRASYRLNYACKHDRANLCTLSDRGNCSPLLARETMNMSSSGRDFGSSPRLNLRSPYRVACGPREVMMP